mmetsp:Transcript_35344/g.54102  ORF Transcript_35344/g.54102 Transcript_35344/m.54102 type:complete len:224 (-) Transcript_35344:324-995(-)
MPGEVATFAALFDFFEVVELKSTLTDEDEHQYKEVLVWSQLLEDLSWIWSLFFIADLLSLLAFLLLLGGLLLLALLFDLDLLDLLHYLNLGSGLGGFQVGSWWLGSRSSSHLSWGEDRSVVLEVVSQLAFFEVLELVAHRFHLHAEVLIEDDGGRNAGDLAQLRLDSLQPRGLVLDVQHYLDPQMNDFQRVLGSVFSMLLLEAVRRAHVLKDFEDAIQHHREV